MATAAERELFILAKEMERPPYHFPEEPTMGNRLQRATRVVLDGRITPNSDGSYTVEGSEHRQYRVADSCSCPQSQKGRTRWCYHAVAVALYVEWCRRTAPQQPLALPPVTVEERLAAPASQEPLGDVMAPDEFIPEPEIDDAPVAVLDTKNGMSHDTPMATPLATALTQWSAQRQVVKEFLRRELVEGTDYYTLQIRGKATKPSLSKAGAEKFLGLLQLQASFAPDLGTWEMLGKPTDQILYVCQLRTRSGEIVGEGRGARSVKQDGGDVNKSIKMSEKSSLIDAVLRTGALSDAFTSDLEDLPEDEPTPPAKPTSQDLRQRIWSIVKERAPEVSSRHDVEAWIHDMTGYALHPDHYRAILHRLEGSLS